MCSPQSCGLPGRFVTVERRSSILPQLHSVHETLLHVEVYIDVRCVCKGRSHRGTARKTVFYVPCLFRVPSLHTYTEYANANLSVKKCVMYKVKSGKDRRAAFKYIKTYDQQDNIIETSSCKLLTILCHYLLTALVGTSSGSRRN